MDHVIIIRDLYKKFVELEYLNDQENLRIVFLCAFIYMFTYMPIYIYVKIYIFTYTKMQSCSLIHLNI